VATHNLAFTKDALGLVIRRLPQPLPGTGAIAEYAELGNFGMRVVMSYQPNTLAQQFTVDVLYGCGVLRKQLGRAGEYVGTTWRGHESLPRPDKSDACRSCSRARPDESGRGRQECLRHGSLRRKSMDLKLYYQKIRDVEIEDYRKRFRS